jgi:ribulose-phosphate 3-epimerase
LSIDVESTMNDQNRPADWKHFDDFAAAGASGMTIHAEVSPHLNRQLARIRELGCWAGVAINPSTPLTAVEEVLRDLDLLLVMSVNPGFGGQTFIPRSESKIKEVRALLDRAGNAAPVEVDGGVDLANIARVVSAGARMIVAGSAVFHSADPERATRDLRAAAAAAAAPVSR